MALIDHDAELARAGANVRGPGGAVLHFMRRYPLGAIGAAIMVVFIGTAFFADYLTSYDPTSTNPRVSLAPPGEDHVLGADFMGGTCCRASSTARASRLPWRSARRRSGASPACASGSSPASSAAGSISWCSA